MLLALIFAAVTLCVLASVVIPIVKSAGAAPAHTQFDRAVYRDQLTELERDMTSGRIGIAEAVTARLEIQRRLLATDSIAAAQPKARLAGHPVLAALLAVLVSGSAAALYLWFGAPGVPDLPFAARSAERSVAASNGHANVEQAEAQLEAKLQANPNDAEGWLLMARTAAELGQWKKSADAYQHAMALNNNGPDIIGAYGETLVLAADGIVTPAARAAFAQALQSDPKSPVARFYLALGELQAGNTQGAIDAWQKLAADAPANSPIRAEIQTRVANAAKAAGLPIPPLAPAPAAPPASSSEADAAPGDAAAAPGPDADAVAAASQMTPEQRSEMIRGMVEKLSAELQSHPGDLNGWLRLGRSYGVLGDKEKSADAYEHAAKLAPDDVSIPLAEVEVLAGSSDPSTPFPERAMSALQRAAALRPDEPGVLWYLGLAAAQQRRFGEAQSYWQRLLPQLPEDSEERKSVISALESIKGK